MRLLFFSFVNFIISKLFSSAQEYLHHIHLLESVPTRVYSLIFLFCRSLFKIGLREAWKGVETNAARLGVVNVCELVTYDVVKELILDHQLMKDNPACHFTSAFLSGNPSRCEFIVVLWV